MEYKKIQVAIVEDREANRACIKKEINSLAHFEVVAESSDGRELLLYLTKATKLPNLILMDMELPSCDGLLATIVCKRLFPQIKVVGISSHSSHQLITEFLIEGGDGFLTKFIAFKTSGIHISFYQDDAIFENALREIINSSEIYLDPLLDYKKETHNSAHSTKAIVAQKFAALSEAEITYLQLNAAGFSRKEIAYLMNKSEDTTKYYMGRLNKHFNTVHQKDLVNVCLNHGIVKIAKFY